MGLKPACAALAVSRATHYRRGARQVEPQSDLCWRPPPPLKLAAQERQAVVDLLHSTRFVDASPHTIYATLLDEGRYLCSARTMYRILAQQDELRERQNLCRHPHFSVSAKTP